MSPVRPRASISLLDPETLSRLGNLSFRARLVVEGFIAGLHQSPYHGFSVEFSEHRPYSPGDEIRLLDWKVYGRTDRFVVKQFQEETNLKAYLVVDASASMGFTSRGFTKLDYAKHLAAALAYLMLKQRDAVGLLTFDERPRTYYPPRSVLSYLTPILTELESLGPGGPTRLGPVLHELAERIRRRGLILVLSDLLDEPAEILSGLRHFRHDGHEVIVFHILDPLERDLDLSGNVVFEDLETHQRLGTQAAHIRRAYREQVRAFIDAMRKQCREHFIDYVLLDTSEPFDRALFEYLVKRKRLRG
ncbi:MAG: DUF58 domain-containing protein [candidate division KSB1 bacterium]|nr:DUF58 domain-containing protein [candidate division KSB1 bacterium]